MSTWNRNFSSIDLKRIKKTLLLDLTTRFYVGNGSGTTVSITYWIRTLSSYIIPFHQLCPCTLNTHDETELEKIFSNSQNELLPSLLPHTPPLGPLCLAHEYSSQFLVWYSVLLNNVRGDTNFLGIFALRGDTIYVGGH